MPPEGTDRQLADEEVLELYCTAWRLQHSGCNTVLQTSKSLRGDLNCPRYKERNGKHVT